MGLSHRLNGFLKEKCLRRSDRSGLKSFTWRRRRRSFAAALANDNNNRSFCQAVAKLAAFMFSKGAVSF